MAVADGSDIELLQKEIHGCEEGPLIHLSKFPQFAGLQSAWNALQKSIETFRRLRHRPLVSALLEQVVDPTLIDCYIYQLNAVQLRYQFLLRRFKRQEAVQSLPL